MKYALAKQNSTFYHEWLVSESLDRSAESAESHLTSIYLLFILLSSGTRGKEDYHKSLSFFYYFSPAFTLLLSPW